LRTSGTVRADRVSMEEYLVLELKDELGFEPPTPSYDAGFSM